MSNTLNNPEKTSTTADQPHTPTTNEEILALLRQLVDQGNTANEQTAPKQNPQKLETAKDASSEDVKRLLEELLKQKSAPANVTTDDDDDSDEDDDFEDDYFWNPGPEWETIGYVAGGAALVGLGALLYHWLKD